MDLQLEKLGNGCCAMRQEGKQLCGIQYLSPSGYLSKNHEGELEVEWVFLLLYISRNEKILWLEGKLVSSLLKQRLVPNAY